MEILRISKFYQKIIIFIALFVVVSCPIKSLVIALFVFIHSYLQKSIFLLKALSKLDLFNLKQHDSLNEKKDL